MNLSLLWLPLHLLLLFFWILLLLLSCFSFFDFSFCGPSLFSSFLFAFLAPQASAFYAPGASAFSIFPSFSASASYDALPSSPADLAFAPLLFRLPLLFGAGAGFPASPFSLASSLHSF